MGTVAGYRFSLARNISVDGTQSDWEGKINQNIESAPVWGNGGSFNRLRNVVEGFGGEPSGSADTNWIFDVAERRPCRKWTPIVARNPNVGGRCERARRSAWSSRRIGLL